MTALDDRVRTARMEDDKRIAAALTKAGTPVESVFDLVNSSGPYPKTIPVLLGILPTVKDEWIREGVVRALTVKEARGVAGPHLLREFERPGAGSTYKWAVGNALTAVATADEYDDMVRLAGDRSHGRAREMLPLAMAAAVGREAERDLLGLIDDEDLAGHVIEALGKIASEVAIPSIRRHADHPKVWVRKAAATAIKRIEKRSR